VIRQGFDIFVAAPVRYGAQQALRIGTTVLELADQPMMVRRLQSEHDENRFRWQSEMLDAAIRHSPESVHEVTLKMAQITAGKLLRAVDREAKTDSTNIDLLSSIIDNHLPTDVNLAELGLNSAELSVLQHQLPNH